MKVVKKTAGLLMLLILSFQSIAFNNTNEKTLNTIGDTFTHRSKVLEQDRSIQVYLPPNYHQSSQQYPVLYVLDGQWHFTNAVAIQQSLRVPNTLPEMIVVGIVNGKKLRRTMFGGQHEKFQQYLADEVLPFIDGKFRTSPERLLFGWEMGAFFASTLFFNEKQLFNGAILSNGAEVSDQEINLFNQLNMANKKYLYIANSIKDIFTIQSSDKLAKQLSATAGKNLNWHYQLFNDEVHVSLPYVAMYQGLKHYYHNFATLSFSSIDEYVKLGGMEYLKDYFVKRGERFGFPADINNSTKNNLIWLAWNRDNYQYFDRFMTSFKDVLSTKRYDSVFWQNNFGRFYLKHGKLKEAQQYFVKAIVKYPNTALLHQGLGKVYKVKGNIKLARENFIKAVALATAASDANLVEFEADLIAIAE
ncbi:MAG: alpha/beta hydrolase-fold protein [Colwellia sp.]|nr:alpha/beta hydrolase-fold protein [Colwellia sp.]